MVIKWMKRIKWMRLSKYVLLITMSLSLVFCGFTIYGARVGNFNLYVHGDGVQLAIYMKEDKSDLDTHLSVPVLDDMTNATFDWFAEPPEVRDSIMLGLGSKNDEESKLYMAFSFVLVNLSDRMVNYTMELTIIDLRQGTDGGDVTGAMRVLIAKEEETETGFEYDDLSSSERRDFFRSANIYALAEKTEEGRERLAEYTTYTTIDFNSETQLFTQREVNFAPYGEVKYTYLMWLEGHDVDCVNDIMGGKVKMRLDITGY